MGRWALVMVMAVVVAAGSTVARAGPPAGGDKWALIVGVDHFLGRTVPVTGSVGDAEDVHQALRRAGWPEDHIRVLTDGAANAVDIRDGLQWLVAHSSNTSYSVFHYSGHVKQAGSTEYLWPHDNRFIADTEVAGYLRQLSGWAWINFSGCEAAGFDEGVSSPRRLVTASSRSDEKSYELPAGERNSVFTSLMVDHGILRREADSNHDGRVSVTEAFNFAAEKAPALTAGQGHGPQHPVLTGGDGSEWFLDGPPGPTVMASRSCFLLCL